jgi:hypothetical protein
MGCQPAPRATVQKEEDDAGACTHCTPSISTRHMSSAERVKVQVPEAGTYRNPVNCGTGARR